MQALEALADLVAHPPSQLHSEAAMDAAGLAIVDFVGVAVAGIGEPVSQIVTDYCRSKGHSGGASVFGGGFMTDPTDAALANGCIGHALDFDDSNFVLGGHPSVVLLPAILALAEPHKKSGAEILRAYLTGFEAMMQIAAAVNFEHYEKGWHPTATLGVFGAAAASAVILGLDAKKTAHALGIAASMSSGLKANFGSMSKPLQVGNAVSKGVQSALWAQAGVDASAAALEGRQGFLTVYNGPGAYRADFLGKVAELPEILRSGLKFKRYPCCGSTHVGIDAALQLRQQQNFAPGAIAGIGLQLNPRRIPHVNRPAVTLPLEAKFSLQYTVAAALLDGHVTLRHFSQAAIERADIRALMAKIEIGAIAAEGEQLGQPCRLTLRLADGREMTVTLDGPAGREMQAYPGYMRDKFIDCATQSMGIPAAQDLFDLCRNFARLDTIDPLMCCVREASPLLPTEANIQ